ncbi:MAG: cytochrome b [Pseudomonadota bacterium]
MIKNTSDGYGLLAILIHWLMALTIFFMFGLGLYMVELTYYDPWYRGSTSLHKSIGLTLVAVYVFRLVWRFSNKKPQPITEKVWERRVAHIMHIALYIAMILLFVSGYLISTADGRAIVIFDLFDVPAIGYAIENQEDIAGAIHEYLAWGLIAMVAVHLIAAIKHQFFDKDGTLLRMLKPAKNKPS